MAFAIRSRALGLDFSLATVVLNYGESSLLNTNHFGIQASRISSVTSPEQLQEIAEKREA